jgi:quercetin dioxygenase-like cupin family protein
VSDHVSTVMSIYDAFGRGDVGTILSKLSDDVAWDEGVRHTSVPYLRAGRGLAHVGEFFVQLAQQFDITVFEPTTIGVAEREVLVRVRVAGSNRVTGIAIGEYPEVHHWVIGADGKVAAFTHVGDWAAHESAAPGGARVGSVLTAVGDTIEVLATGGQFEVFCVSGPSQSGPPPHSHPWREAYFGIDGEIEVMAGDVTMILMPGQFLSAESGMLHSYRILSESAKFLVITGGSRASGFFADLDANALYGVPTPETFPAIIEVARRNGLSSPLFV